MNRQALIATEKAAIEQYAAWLISQGREEEAAALTQEEES